MKRQSYISRMAQIRRFVMSGWRAKTSDCDYVAAHFRFTVWPGNRFLELPLRKVTMYLAFLMVNVLCQSLVASHSSH